MRAIWLIFITISLAGCGKPKPENTLPTSDTPFDLGPEPATSEMLSRCIALLKIDHAEYKQYPGLGAIYYGAIVSNGVHTVFNLHHSDQTVNGIKVLFRFEESRSIDQAEQLIRSSLAGLYDKGEEAFNLLMDQPSLCTKETRHINVASHGITISYTHAISRPGLDAISLDLITREHQQTMRDQHFK